METSIGSAEKAGAPTNGNSRHCDASVTLKTPDTLTPHLQTICSISLQANSQQQLINPSTKGNSFT